MGKEIARVLFCGGRFSARHSKINLNCSGDNIPTIILTDKANFGNEKYVTESINKNVRIVDTGEKAISIPQKLYKSREYLANYSKIVLCGVDDLIPEESITGFENSASQKNSIATSFGIDLSYIPNTVRQRGRIFSMDRYSIASAKRISQSEYWGEVKKILLLDNSLERITQYFGKISSFPFVYSVYNTSNLIGLCKAFLASLNACQIPTQSGMAAILFEYIVIATSINASKIDFTEKVFRLNNYSASSAGADSYNYRTFLTEVNEQKKVNYLLEVFSLIYANGNLELEKELTNNLRCGYLMVATQSILMQKITEGLHIGREQEALYQSESLKYMKSRLVSAKQGSRIEEMIENWHE